MKKLIFSLCFLLICGSAFATNYCDDANNQGCWLLPEGSGTTTADSSGNSHTLTFRASGEPAWAAISGTGYPTYADYELDFDGSNDYIYRTAPFVTNLQITGSMSAGGWFYYDAYDGTFDALMSVGDTEANEADNFTWELYTDSAGKPHVFWEYGASTNEDTGAIGNAVGTEAWVHIAFTRTTGADSSVTIYINGSSAGTVSSLTNASGGTDGEISIGGQRIANNFYFNGKMAELFVFDKVLSEANINDIINNGLVSTARRVIIME